VNDSNEDFKLWGQGKIAELATFVVGSEKTFVMKPLTFMNLSGQAVVAAASYFRILPEDICVVYDELDLPFGDVRLKVGGGDGGHNGLKSITQAIGTSNYSRIRMGIGRPPHPSMDPADYVLGHFSNTEFETVDVMIDRAVEAIGSFIKGTESFRLAMNSMNQRTKE
jgi:PTH1 family peptidyl-tRNA hydrolase